MNNARFGQWVTLQIGTKAFPVERDFLTPPIEPLKYQMVSHITVAAHCPAIATDTIVLIVPS